ncbi:hypothetical protein Syn8016DRAFT_0728 [Synechococcus sp. WH 8016]|jgi:hypothetical protein|nr:hypothetical protein Syn8016DRAFT_0728 [Synechococcus sp. WH 8016]
MVLARAQELEQLLEAKQLPSNTIKLLKFLTQSTLDQPLNPDLQANKALN